MSLDLTRNGRRPRADVSSVATGAPARLWCFPHGLTSLEAEGGQESPLPRAAKLNDGVLHEERRRSIAPDVVELSQVAGPQRLSVNGVAVHAGRVVPDNHTLSVGDGCRPAVVVGLVRVHHLVEGGGLSPQFGSRLSIEAVQRSLAASIFGTGDEHAAGGDDRAAVALFRQRKAPADVLLRTPGERKLRFIGRAVSSGTPEGGPVASRHSVD